MPDAPDMWTCDIIPDTPVGAVIAVARGKRLLAVEIGLKRAQASPSRILRRYDRLSFDFAPNAAGDELREYFAGRRRSFTLKPVLAGLSRFRQKVLSACAEVPFGEVRTYGELARAVRSPRAFRAVGGALRQNPCPIIVPCHRIVAAVGLGGFSARGGLRAKRALLRLEGVVRRP